MEEWLVCLSLVLEIRVRILGKRSWYFLMELEMVNIVWSAFVFYNQKYLFLIRTDLSIRIMQFYLVKKEEYNDLNFIFNEVSL